MTSETVPNFESDIALTMLSRLLLSTNAAGSYANLPTNLDERENMLALANSHHVVVRAMDAFHKIACAQKNLEAASWASAAIMRERARIKNATSFLGGICQALESNGCGVMVIKSLDHWPDMGSDLDLYTDSPPEIVVALMKKHFDARIAARSWGDRLANKWNFLIDGLPELVEIHVSRLGQTGEQTAIAARLSARSRPLQIAGRIFAVAGTEDRLMICTLQRMYRHFYARLCDIVDTASLVASDAVDFSALRAFAHYAGIWQGVATFLVVVSDYVEQYRGSPLDLPAFVKDAAAFGVESIRFERGFLRIPILPHSARLYTSELTDLLRKGDLWNTARLTLLPLLATAAVIGQKVTGSDKGIW